MPTFTMPSSSQRAVRRIARAVTLLAIAACSHGGPGSSPDDGAPDPARDATPGPVMTDAGPVLGHSAGAITAFLGIPYAAPPVGALRWRAPAPAAAWTVPRDASALGAACAQSEGGLGQTGPYSEDCLTVNVWSAAPSSAARAPVMVFLHGGAFVHGGSNQPGYDGARLAAAGVVVVTLNYRLGVFGFLAHPALTAEDAHGSSGNYGLLDQQAALRWVHANIAGFGGDPDNVTMFGESAGSMSVCSHLASPLAAGLFRRAIGESGACNLIATPLAAPPGAAQPGAEALGAAIAGALGCDGAADAAACMRSKTADELIAAAPGSEDVPHGGAKLWPNIDGYVLPEPPAVALAAGRGSRADAFLGGVNQDEATLFTAGTTITTEAEYEAAVTALVPGHASEALALYPAASYPTVKDAYNALMTDLVFACPTRAQIAALARHGTRTFEYLFTHLTPFGRATRLGVHHGSELPFVFGNLTAGSGMSAADRALSDQVIGYWTRFAAAGDPGTVPVAWPPRTAADDALLEIGDPIQAAIGLHVATCDAIATWRTAP